MSGKLLRNWNSEWNEVSQLNISSYAVKKAYSSLCSTFFTKNFFAALEGRNLSNSSLTEVFEVNVKFVAT